MNKDIIAKIGNEEIENSEFMMHLQHMDPKLVADFMNKENGFKTLVEDFVNQKLMIKYGYKNKLNEEEDFKKVLKFWEESLLRDFVFNKIVSDANEPTEDEIKEYYEKNIDSMTKTFINASHILVDTIEEANSIIDELNDGKSFEDLAKEKSKCPSAKNGGNLGDFSQGQMVKEFDEVVFKMKEGEISKPVKTQFGYHVIKLNKINSSQKPDLEAAKDHIRSELLRIAKKDLYTKKCDELKQEYNVEILV